MGFRLYSVLMEPGTPCVTGYISEKVDEVAIIRTITVGYLHVEMKKKQNKSHLFIHSIIVCLLDILCILIIIITCITNMNIIKIFIK